MCDKILIVDDDPLILTCFERLLRKRFRIETVLGSRESLDSILKLGPYAVVLCDMRMPGITGIELLAKLKEKSPATVCLILTGDADMASVSAAIRNGLIYRLVEKPCIPEDLIAILEEALCRYGVRPAVPLYRAQM